MQRSNGVVKLKGGGRDGRESFERVKSRPAKLDSEEDGGEGPAR